jgi:hypothetical protein
MKKLTIYMVLAFFAGTITTGIHANAGPKDVDWGEVITVMDKTAASGNMPDFIDNPGATRGAGFNGEHVFVASRQGGGNFVYYWDVNNPDAEAGMLDMTGVAGGYHVINDMTVVDNHVFVSNMILGSGEFKIYHWDALDAAPNTLISYNANVRLGDAFTVVGDPDEYAFIAASTWGASDFYIWEIENGSLIDEDPQIIPWQLGDELLNFSRVTEVIGTDYLLASGPAFGPVLLNSNAIYMNDIPVDFFPGWPMYAHIFHYNEQRFLAYVHVGESPAENTLHILDLNDGSTVAMAMNNLVDAGFESSVLHSVSIGNTFNGNASVSVDVVIDDDGNLHLMAFAAGNGFIVQKIEGGEQPIDPADPLWMSSLLDKTGDDLPVEIGSDGNARSAAIYMDRYVVVPSREGEPNVWVWDSHTPGLEPFALEYDENIIEDMIFPINYVRTVGEDIYVSNLTLDPTGSGWAQGVFRVYRWNDLESGPEIVISYDAEPGRLGDAFSIIGDPKGDGHIIAHINTTKDFRVWTFENGVLINEDNPTMITLGIEPDHINNHGIYNSIPGEEDLFLVTSNNTGIMIADLDGEVHASWGTDIIDMRSYDPNIFYYGDKRYLTYTINNEGNPDVGAVYKIVDISMGANVLEAFAAITNSNDLEARTAYSKSLGAGNPNLTATNQVVIDDEGAAIVLAHVVGTGFIMETTGEAPETYALILEVHPEGTGNVSGAGAYVEGSTVPVSATPADGYQFVNWTDTDENTISTQASFSFTMPAEETTLIANFEEIPAVDVSTLAELREKPADGTVYLYTGNAVIVAMDGFRNRKFIQDETAAILIDDDPGIITTEYELYDVITNIEGEINIWNNLVRFQPTANTAEAIDNAPVDPAVFLLNEVASGDQAKLVVFEKVFFTNADGDFINGQNYTISDGENTFELRTDFYDVDYIGQPIPGEETHLDITGVILQYQETLQIVPRFADDFVVLDDDDVSVHDHQNPGITVFPNPASDVISIHANANIKSVRMMDMLGQVVYSGAGHGHQHQVELGGLRNGVYFIQVFTEAGSITERIQLVK